MAAFALLAASDGDADFIFDSFVVSMRRYVEWAWGWNDEFQQQGFWKNLPIQKLQIICIDGARAGVLCVEEDDRRHWIRTIFLRPEFQGRGVGSALLQQEAGRARRAGKDLVLKVIKINPARNLYDRLGFKVVGEDDATCQMELKQDSI